MSSNYSRIMSILDKMKPKREGRWQDDPPTDKQLEAIKNMAEYLNWTYILPLNKLQACNIINEMKTEISNRKVLLSGSNYDFLYDQEDDDWYYNTAYDFDIW